MAEEAVTKIRLEAEGNVSSVVDAATGSLQQFGQESGKVAKSTADLARSAGLSSTQLEKLAQTMGVSSEKAAGAAKHFNELKKAGKSNVEILRAVEKQSGLTGKQFGALNGFMKGTQKSAAGLQGGLKGVVGGLTKFAGVAAGVVAAGSLVSFFKNTTNEAVNFQRVFGGIEGLIERTGGAAGVTGKQIDEFAKQLGRDTLTSRDAVLEASRSLLPLTNVVGENFFKTIELSQDIVEALGGSLPSAVQKLGRALENPVENLTTLRRSGIEFTRSQKDQIKTLVESGKLLDAQAIILQKVEERYGGAGKAAAVGLGAALDTLGEEVGDLRKTIGTQLAGLATPIANLAVQIISHINNLPGPIQDALDGIKGLLSEVGSLASAIASGLAPAFNQSAAAASRLAGLLLQSFGSLSQIIVDQVQSAADALHPFFEVSGKIALTTINTVSGGIQKAFDLASELILKARQGLALLRGNEDDALEAFDFIRSANDAEFGNSNRLLEQFNALRKKGTDITDTEIGKLDELKTRIESQIADNQKRIAETRRFIDTTGKLGDAQKQEIANLEEQNTKLKEGLSGIGSFVAQTKLATSATLDNAAAIKKQIDAQTAAQKKLRNTEKRDAQRQFNRNEDAIKDQEAKAQKDLAKQLSDDIEAIEDARDERISQLEKARDREVADLKKQQEAEIAAEQKRFTKQQEDDEKAFLERIKAKRKEIDDERSIREKQLDKARELADDGRLSRADQRELARVRKEEEERRAIDQLLKDRVGITDLDNQEKDLDKQEEDFAKQQEAEREAFEEKLEAKREAQEKARQALQELHQDKIDAIKEASQKRIEAIKEAGEVRRQEMAEAFEDAREARKQAFEDLQRKLDEASALKIEAIKSKSEEDRAALLAESQRTAETARGAYASEVAKANQGIEAALSKAGGGFAQSVADADAAAQQQRQQAEQEFNQGREQVEQERQQAEQEQQSEQQSSDVSTSQTEDREPDRPTPETQEQRSIANGNKDGTNEITGKLAELLTQDQPQPREEKADSQQEDDSTERDELLKSAVANDVDFRVNLLDTLNEQTKIIAAVLLTISNSTLKLLEFVTKQDGIASDDIPSLRSGGSLGAGRVADLHQGEFFVSQVPRDGRYRVAGAGTVLNQADSMRVVRELMLPQIQPVAPTVPITPSPIVPRVPVAAGRGTGEIGSKLDRISQQLARLEQVGGQHQHVGSQTISILNEINPGLMEDLVRQVGDRSWQQFSSALDNLGRRG